MRYYYLDSNGKFICDVFLDTPENNGHKNWTTVPMPQPIGWPRLVGERLSTGEWIGEWIDDKDVEEPTKNVPKVVSRFQAKAALYHAGLLEEAEMIVENSDTITKMAWTEAQEFYRTSPTLGALGNLLGLTEEQIDQLFIDAKKIEA